MMALPFPQSFGGVVFASIWMAFLGDLNLLIVISFVEYKVIYFGSVLQSSQNLLNL